MASAASRSTSQPGDSSGRSTSPLCPRGFGELDEIAGDPAGHGLVVVQAAKGVIEAIARHVERRARAHARPALIVVGLPSDDPWRELAARLGALRGVDPIASAQAIVDKGADAVVVVEEGEPTAWGHAVAEEIARLVSSPPAGGRGILVFSCRDAAAAQRIDKGARARGIEIDPALSPDDMRRWWDAIARDADRQVDGSLDRIDTIDAWWGAVRAAPSIRRAPLDLSEDARRLFTRITLSRRSWLVADLDALGPAAAIEELVARGVMIVDATGRLIPSAAVPAIAAGPAADAADIRAVAEALERLADPWAAVRAGELHALEGSADRVEAAILRAFERLTDPAARADLFCRWQAALDALPDGEAAPSLLRVADLALRTGDVDRALGFARGVIARAGDTFDALLMLGRATAARGDLISAAFTLKRALDRASGDAARARASAELAEVRYMAGDPDEARRLAEASLACAPDLGARLLARNVLGKLLLASASFTEAEEHFAADACEAQIGGDLLGDRRARMNRAVAVLSSGRHLEAREMLEAILDEAERHGEIRAVAFALTNLATIAQHRHEIALALSLSERAFDLRRRLGDRYYLALIITNLADLRIQIGQIDQAEQALTFGRHACGPGMPRARLAHFALTAARIHLARGDTLQANKEIAAATASASASHDGNKVGECDRLAARAALEDGDVTRAAASIAAAAGRSITPSARAELKLLTALHQEAVGEPFRAAACEARALAREAESVEIHREAEVVLHRAARAEGDARAARAHLDAAIGLRSRFVDRLPEDLRASYLARRELVALAALEAAASSPGSPESSPSMRPPPSFDFGGRPPSQAPASARIVGRDPAVSALLHAVQKVGPSDATVLIRGESGTGKELVAEAIHEASARRSGPLVKVNCAALVETLLLSELFGHEKGAFTGASARKRGRFEMAEGGTLFLDEIGDISPRSQVALLRVLQEKTFERVGGTAPIQADVRILCATHRDLRALVSRGEFREDLYYRLRGVVLEVPALRHRLGDLEAICASILARIAAERGGAPKRMSPEAIAGLSRHAWPGNIRELENALRAAALFADGEALTLDDFTSNVDGLHDLAPPRSGTPDASDSGVLSRSSGSERQGDTKAPQLPTDVAYAHVRGGVSLSDMKRHIERECIARALSDSGRNITRAAALLGMKRPRLSQLVKQYGFGSDAFEADAEAEES